MHTKASSSAYANMACLQKTSMSSAHLQFLNTRRSSKSRRRKTLTRGLRREMRRSSWLQSVRVLPVTMSVQLQTNSGMGLGLARPLRIDKVQNAELLALQALRDPARLT